MIEVENFKFTFGKFKDEWLYDVPLKKLDGYLSYLEDLGDKIYPGPKRVMEKIKKYLQNPKLAAQLELELENS